MESLQKWCGNRSVRQLPWPALLPAVAGCAPYVEVGGAYFPAWLLSILLGSAGAATLRLVLVRKEIDPFLQSHALAWPSIVVALSSFFWLVFFSR